MRLFCLQLEASCLQLSFSAYNCVLELFHLQLELFYLQLELFCLQWEVRQRSTLTDCKQRRSTVSKKTPTVSKKTFPPFHIAMVQRRIARPPSSRNNILVARSSLLHRSGVRHTLQCVAHITYRVMLGRDCFRAIFRKQFPPPLNWLKSGFSRKSRNGLKVGEKCVFDPLFTYFCTQKPTCGPISAH